MNCCSFGSVLLVCSSFNVCVWIKTNIPGSVYVVFTQWFPEWGAGAPGGQFSMKTAVLLLVYSVLNHVQWTIESSPVSVWGVGDGAPTNLGTTVSTHVCHYNERCRGTHCSNTVSVSVYLKNNWLLICDVCHTDLVKLHLVNISAPLMHQSNLPSPDSAVLRKSDPQLSQQSWISASFSFSQGRLAALALWHWLPKMLCPLPWPSQSRLMPTSKELIPLSESHMTCDCWKASATDLHAHTFLSIIELKQ